MAKTMEASEMMTDGQVNDLMSKILDAVRKHRGEISLTAAQRALSTINIGMACFAPFRERAQDVNSIVKLTSGAEVLELDATDGKQTIAQAKDAFPGYIDGDFREWGCDVKSAPTGKTEVAVYEMIKDGDFARIFNGMSDDLNKLVLTQPQIIKFVQKHRQWLRTEGYGTFFLFKVGDEFFVARVLVDGGGQLKARVYRFSYDDVWHAEGRRRIVVPQLTLES